MKYNLLDFEAYFLYIRLKGEINYQVNLYCPKISLKINSINIIFVEKFMDLNLFIIINYISQFCLGLINELVIKIIYIYFIKNYLKIFINSLKIYFGSIIKYLKTAYYDKCLPDNIVRCRF